MEHTISGFSNRMELDRDFRRKMLADWKSGELAEALLAEGYVFSPDELNQNLPQVRTGIRAGSCEYGRSTTVDG